MIKGTQLRIPEDFPRDLLEIPRQMMTTKEDWGVTVDPKYYKDGFNRAITEESEMVKRLFLTVMREHPSQIVERVDVDGDPDKPAAGAVVDGEAGIKLSNSYRTHVKTVCSKWANPFRQTYIPGTLNTEEDFFIKEVERRWAELAPSLVFLDFGEIGNSSSGRKPEDIRARIERDPTRIRNIEWLAGMRRNFSPKPKDGPQSANPVVRVAEKVERNVAKENKARGLRGFEKLAYMRKMLAIKGVSFDTRLGTQPLVSLCQVHGIVQATTVEDAQTKIADAESKKALHPANYPAEPVTV